MFKQYRKTWVEVNLGHIYDNYKQIKARCQKEVIPVIKANAYGHGALAVADYLVEKGVKYFAVSLLEEALEIKAKHPDIDILVMGVISPHDLPVVSEKNITFTVSQMHLYNAMKSFKGSLKCHIKVDTGMHRLGFINSRDVFDIFDDANREDHIIIEGIYTHFATSDSDEAYLKQQLRKFSNILNKLDKAPKMVHVSNTSAALKYEKHVSFSTHARVGIGLFGLSLEKEDYGLKNTFKLCSTIVEEKILQPGDKLGYSITYEANAKEKIGILPIGYADGIIRKNQGGFVSINNKPYPIVGRVCMDQMFVKISDAVTIGDTVTIMGDSIVSLDDVAKRLDTITYEVLCQITYRVPRIYTNRK